MIFKPALTEFLFIFIHWAVEADSEHFKGECDLVISNLLRNDLLDQVYIHDVFYVDQIP